MDLSARRPGPDVVRALAMAGVVMMNYHGYLILRGARQDGGAIYDVFDPWIGPLATRFAATFVLTAGVGVTLMTRSSVGDPERTNEMRWRLVRRGILLYSAGLLFDFVWPGTILPYYGAMFVLAAAMFTLRIRWVALIGATAAVAGWLIRWMVFERSADGRSTEWLTDPGQRSPSGLMVDVLVNGTHPLLPWLAFFCAGIVLGRILPHAWWRPSTIAVGFAFYSTAAIAVTFGSSERSLLLSSDDPFDRGIVYVASALGTALIAFGAISWIADRLASNRFVDALRRAGQMSLTIYLGHALMFNLVVDWLGPWLDDRYDQRWLERITFQRPSGIGSALTAVAIYWLTATAAAVAYQKRRGRGPAEVVYRKLTN